MKKTFIQKYDLVLLLIAVIIMTYAGSFVHFRLDLTAEKRFTLSSSTRAMLRELDEPVRVTVFLEGDMPAGFRKLSNSTRELLGDFKEYAGANLVVRFQKIGEGLEGDAKAQYLDSMARLGLRPYTIRVQVKKEEASEDRTIVPGALIEYKGRAKAVNLLSGIAGESIGFDVINRAENLLEYNFAAPMEQIIREETPLVGYLLGNGELQSQQIKQFMEQIVLPNYRLVPLPIDSFFAIPPAMDALIILKPTLPFSDRQKIKIDQYVMNGGKVIWLIDRLYAEMDSLMRSQGDFVAFDRNLNLDDLLFRYGVRIQPDLIQDLQCDKIPLVVGSMGDQPQIELADWYYFPLLQPSAANPIAKNLNLISSKFPHSIDTISTEKNQKTILLSSSAGTRVLQTPAVISLNSVKTREDLEAFSQGSKPVAVLMEGAFQSLYKNRISKELRDSMELLAKQPFQDQISSNQMIVIADADIAMNPVTQEQGPLEMGANPYSNETYGNREFMLNCMEYLINPSGILETRGKDFTLRLLDARKSEEQKGIWQMINLAVPLLLVLLFGVLFQFLRRRAFSNRA